MKLICIMPARGGSTRIPGKNIIDFHGKPIMAWPLEVLVKSHLVNEVFVSSDSKEILQVASQLGAQTISRPDNLSDNFVGIVPVVQHAINSSPKAISDEDLVLCVFPTNVWLTEGRIQEAINNFSVNVDRFVIGIARYPHSLDRSLSGEPSELLMNSPEFAKTRTQDAKSNFYDAGYLCLGSKKMWMTSDSVFDSPVFGMELTRTESIDIDNLEDLEFAREIFTSQRLRFLDVNHHFREP